MRKRILAVILAGVLTGMNLVPVWATEVAETTVAQEETSAAQEEGSVAEGEATEATEEETTTGVVINPDNFVDVEVIDLSLHAETTGDFSAVYKVDNPYMGQDTSKGVVMEFYAKPTWEVHVLGAIFAINGTGDYDGKLYFTPGSYFGFNSGNFGGYFDANLFNYAIVTDYIKDGAKIKIEITPKGFAVYANEELCYDQTILDNPEAGAGDYTSESDFSPVLSWLTGADTLYFGYGSWWNGIGGNEANINLSDISFRLMDGTVLLDQLQADKELVESLGGSVDLVADGSAGAGSSIELAQVDVEIFDINSVEYEGASVLGPMVVAVGVALVLAVVVIVMVLKKRTYDDI